MKKICLIIPYFGKWPSWMPYYFKSCEFNPTITWLLFTDCGKPKNCPKNVKIINFSINDFNKLASKKLKLNINIKKPYKLCDLKPAYGTIFEDYLESYDFWGHTDIDMIYGDIKKFITDNILRKYDVITSRDKYLAGFFTLYKNCKKTNRLYKKCPSYKKIFLDSDNLYSFDECNLLHTQLDNNIQVPKKRLKLNNMTYIVKEYSKNGLIKSHFKDLCKDLNPIKNFKLYFNKGRITSNDGKREHLYFHFYLAKKIYGKNTQKIKRKTPNRFYITNYEIFFNREATPKIKKLYKMLQLHKQITNFYLGQIGILIKRYWPKLYFKLKSLTIKKDKTYLRKKIRIKQKWNHQKFQL